jgi:predicted nucleic acid-binding protein
VIVLDASAVVELLLGGRRGQSVLHLLAEQEGEVHAPGLVDVEVTQVLRRLVSASVISPSRGRASSEILQELGIHRHPERPLLPRMWTLRENLTAYDTAYVALAEALACPLATFDRKVAGAPGVGVEVRLLG